MIFYHADTGHNLHENMSLQLHKTWDLEPNERLLTNAIIRSLFPNGISSYGIRAIMKPSTQDQWNMQLFDILCESVRILNFPHLPSRLTSVYAARSPEAARKWCGIIGKDASEFPVFAVECNNACIFDAQILDAANLQHDTREAYPARLSIPAFRYWESGVPLDETLSLSEYPIYPKEEILLVPPVKVLYQV